MSAVDLSLLPPPDVIETLDYETILGELKAAMIASYPPEEQDAITALLELESEPITKMMEIAAYRELLLRARYNDEARELLLALATGADLDHIGVTYYQESRLTVSPANPAAIPPILAIMESDDDYRYRLALKPESYSVAGPKGAFEFHALSADGNVKSASVTSPIKGTTEVFVLSRTGNGVPDAPLLAAVEAKLNGQDMRPESEEVLVTAGAVQDYTINVSLTLFPGAVGELATQAATAALEKFAAETHKLGADVILSAITAAAHQPGVKKVAITSPAADIVCAAGQAPYCTGITVNVAGVEA